LPTKKGSRIFYKFKRKLLGNLCHCAVGALLFYFEGVSGTALEPGIVAVIQTFGKGINFHPHLHFLVTEGRVGEAGVFYKVGSLNDGRLAEIFAREILSFLVGREHLSPEWAERLLSWRRTGFNVNSKVRAKTRQEAELVGKYMIRPPSVA
jgi:hypothetical protein